LLEGSSAWEIAKKDEAKPIAASGATITSFQVLEKRKNKAKV